MKDKEISKYKVKDIHIEKLNKFIDKLTNEQKSIITDGNNADRKNN